MREGIPDEHACYWERSDPISQRVRQGTWQQRRYRALSAAKRPITPACAEGDKQQQG
jgi:hypothetical protein